MNGGVYIVSDGTLMDFDSLKTYLIYELGDNSKRMNWSFDDFTGGEGDFVSEESYLKAKKWFNRYKKRKLHYRYGEYI